MSRRRRGQRHRDRRPPAGESQQLESEDWKVVRREAQDRRHARGVKLEADLVKLVARGVLDAKQFSEHHWRIWIPGSAERSVDFWPNSGTFKDGADVRINAGLRGALQRLEEKERQPA